MGRRRHGSRARRAQAFHKTTAVIVKAAMIRRFCMRFRADMFSARSGSRTLNCTRWSSRSSMNWVIATGRRRPRLDSVMKL